MQVLDEKATSLALKDLRIANNFSVVKIANVLHISKNAVYKWERNVSMPTIDNLIILCSLYGCSIDSIIKTREI